MSSLEEYTLSLEAAIQERTTDYLDEKRKTEELLYELLPRSHSNILFSFCFCFFAPEAYI